MSASEGNHDGRYNRTQNAQNRLQSQFRAVLDLLLPGNGNDILPIGQGGWPHWPGLKAEILTWMDESRGPGYEARQVKLFGPGVILAEVTTQHLVGDFWLVSTQHAGVNEWGRVEVVIGPPVAQAILRFRRAGAGCRKPAECGL